MFRSNTISAVTWARKRCIRINWYIGYYVFCLHIKTAEKMSALVAINRMGNNRISHDFFPYALIPTEFLVEKEGAHCSERHGSDLVLEGILVSLPLWYAKLTSGFWKENLCTHTVRYLMYLHPHISTGVAYRQTLLLALGMCSDTLSALTQHHLARFLKPPLVFYSFFLSVFGTGFLSDGHGENKGHVNSTTPPHRSMLPEYQVLIMKSFVWELPGLPPRLVFISQSVPQKRQLPCDSCRI